LVAAVLGNNDPPANKVVIFGFFGPSKLGNNFIRLYLGFDFACYYEIPTDDDSLVSFTYDQNDANGPTLVIAQPNSRWQLVQGTAVGGGAAFLAGGITAGLLGKVADSAALKEAFGLVPGTARRTCPP
jgi:hypothetical protein